MTSASPRWTLPGHATDAHCHVFGPADRFPFAPTRTYTPADAGVEQLDALHERLGLSRAVLVQASCHGTDNAAMVDALHRGNGRFAGVAMIDESFTTADVAALHEAGVRGIRFNFVRHLGGTPDLGTFLRLVDRIQPLGWHVVLHFDADDLARHAGMLDELPCPYVIDHMGRIPARGGVEQESLQALLELLRDTRAWVKISGAERLTADGLPPYDDVVPLAQALVAAAPDRVLWGTDWPHPNVRHVPDDGDLVDLLEDLVPDEATRHRVLVTNPERLYDFG
jgi:predicted TIM-barrel fold metal-dependent hydrolase